MDELQINSLKGIGPKSEQLYHRLGIYTVGDLRRHYPRDYDIYQESKPVSELKADEICAVEGFLSKGAAVRRVKHLQIIAASVKDLTGELNLTWYNIPFIANKLKAGSRLVFRGKVIVKGRRVSMEQPEVFTREEYEQKLHGMQPIYPLTTGLTNKAMIKSMEYGLEKLHLMKEFLPDRIRKKYELAEYNFAVPTVHFPENQDSFIKARKRFVFEEFFIFIMALRKMKETKEVTLNHFKIESAEEAEKLKGNLPYELTKAQEKVWQEIKADLKGEQIMSRLVQGDVGSGKTIIAVLAMLMTAQAGYQAALMAPTEVLARQHFEAIQKLLIDNGLAYGVELLTGSLTAKEKRESYERIESGEVQLIIGTHALIQEKVSYVNLALVITDEQHRFGVKQRETFSEKGKEPHVLVMSATPIPRTLAIIIYGDLDISVIDELPAERVPIKNCVVDTTYRAKAYAFIEKEVREGRQAYIICAMVEESENLDVENVIEYTADLQKKVSADIKVEYLHGKMKQKEKNDIMERYARREIDVLVSTTVIEVGVNVPNASVMMVENAERFGLAQLHQLRGRVGRGKHQSYCIFVNGSDSKSIKKRLEILNESNDGFYIANEDLKLRGPGDLFGIRQSGLLEFKIGDVFTDAKILKEASQAAKEMMVEDPELEKEENKQLKIYLEHYMRRAADKINL